MTQNQLLASLSAINRRDLLIGGVAASTAMMASINSSQASTIRFGAAAMKENMKDDPLYREALIKHCDIIVPMNDLKWEALRPEQKKFAFEDADLAINFAKSNGKSVRGHALCWYEALPNWMKAINSPKEAEAELRNHIETVVWKYRSAVPSWDVVNEAIAHDPAKQGIWREGYWQKTLGEKHVDIAFDAAAKTDPKAQLVYSDYDLENTGERETLRRKHTLDLVRRLKDKKIPIHGVGFQAHLYAERTIDEDGLARFARALKAFDVVILVTESTGASPEHSWSVIKRLRNMLAVFLQPYQLKAHWIRSSRGALPIVTAGFQSILNAKMVSLIALCLLMTITRQSRCLTR
jgi:endo-1,4-beta-xylanase